MQDAVKETNRKLAQVLARTMFRQDWAEENPDGATEDFKEAYQDAKTDQLKQARRLMRALERRGVVLSMTEEVAET